VALRLTGAADGAFVARCAANSTHSLVRLMEKECIMTAFNTVRFRVKPGREQDFLDAHKSAGAQWPGLRHANMIKTGDRAYCIIAEWTDLKALTDARPQMIATLDSFRDTLEDLGNGLGVTDPVAGSVVLAIK
jgi:hypothetical protein